jgi:hypothetical protein
MRFYSQGREGEAEGSRSDFVSDSEPIVSLFAKALLLLTRHFPKREKALWNDVEIRVWYYLRFRMMYSGFRR